VPGSVGPQKINESFHHFNDSTWLRGSEERLTIEGQEVLVGGDEITALDGQIIETIEQLVQTVGGNSAGDEVNLTIIRAGETQTVQVVLAERSNL
jgi:S1-C subfamily serine protease